MSFSSLISDDYVSEARSRRRKSKLDSIESEKERLKKALEEEGIKSSTFLQILKENMEEWPFLLLAITGTITKGVSRPIYSLVYGFLFRVSFLYEEAT